ncbi:MAG TPA: peptidase E [Mycobacteriales bacterium]|nr:peptidase E [Mycobacteriales bacterium]
MPTRHIVAFGGAGLGETDGRRPLLSHALSLAGKEEPRICYVPTALGDSALAIVRFYDIARELPCRPSHLTLFTMPNVADLRSFVLSQDVVYVEGGSVANLLAVWRVHGLDAILREAWQAGVVLCGTSAGSLCWFEGGTTDSFGPALQLVTGGLGLIAASNTPHYDSEPERRPLYQSLVASGALSAGWAADDHVGLHFVDDAFHEAIAARAGARAWRVERSPTGDSAVETEITPRLV